MPWSQQAHRFRGVSHRLTWATTPRYSAPELFSDFHTLSGDVWSIGMICYELLHTQLGARAVWSDGDPRTEGGARKWVAVAKHHSMLLHKIRGTGPPVPGLMGMDMCVGCCQMEVHQRLTAEQVANHPFVLIFRKWSAEMGMISALAPLLRRMPPSGATAAMNG